MATALHPSRPDNGSTTLATDAHVGVYPRGLAISDLDFGDTRYPTLSPHRPTSRLINMLPPSSSATASWYPSQTNEWPETSPSDPPIQSQMNERRGPDGGIDPVSRKEEPAGDQQSPHQPPLNKPDSVVSYSIPAGASRRVVERYSLDEAAQRDLSAAESSDAKAIGLDPTQSSQDITPTSQVQQQQQQPVQQQDSPEQHNSILPTSLRHQQYSTATGLSAGPSYIPTFSPIVSSSAASPSFNSGMQIPISPNHRAYPQQPTYITPAAAPNPLNPVFSPTLVPQEEICVECAMRDQDMADVDVTSPGVWERESDALFEDLVQREREEEVSGVVNSESPGPPRPRAKGDRLTEQNMKVWLSVNPREPTSRHQTLEMYLKSQRLLLEAEALAHARAMQESRQLDNRMRDAYSQLRRSAYDTGNSAAPIDDVGRVRIKSPRNPSSPTASHVRSQSREVTLLENGMIIEHVDVRKEEREERERKRKEERRDRSRARKSSRGSGFDVTSVYSAASLAPQTEGGLSLGPTSRFSQSGPQRPASVLTAPLDRPSLPRAVSQASFSDIHSLGSASPRRTRFFGFKNLSAGFRSRDSLTPSGMSGSMVDMHVALQREAYGQPVQSPIDLGSRTPSLRHSQIWPTMDGESADKDLTLTLDKPKKKKSGLAKIWRIMTGSSCKGDLHPANRGLPASLDKTEDDLPLAPPPPLSYLVDRRTSDHVIPGARRASSPSPTSIGSPKNTLISPGVSSATAPSSLVPSPTSSRLSAAEREAAAHEGRKSGGHIELDHELLKPLSEECNRMAKNVHPVISEPDMRQQSPQFPIMANASLTVPQATLAPRPFSAMLIREKSLPPLPGESKSRPPLQSESRPRTLYTYDPRQIPMGAAPPSIDLQPPRAPFRTGEVRRQSFGGLASRPQLGLQTMPINGGLTGEPLRLPGGRYDEFGISRRSLGRLENAKESRNITSPTPKRKSRFGLASLLGRKSHIYEKEAVNTSREFPTRSSASHGRDESMTLNGYAGSGSRHSAGPRISVTSRKAIEEAIEQDSNFIAYRYPSNDQHLDLLR